MQSQSLTNVVHVLQYMYFFVGRGDGRGGFCFSQLTCSVSSLFCKFSKKCVDFEWNDNVVTHAYALPWLPLLFRLCIIFHLSFSCSFLDSIDRIRTEYKPTNMVPLLFCFVGLLHSKSRQGTPCNTKKRFTISIQMGLQRLMTVKLKAPQIIGLQKFFILVSSRVCSHPPPHRGQCYTCLMPKILPRERQNSVQTLYKLVLLCILFFFFIRFLANCFAAVCTSNVTPHFERWSMSMLPSAVP